MTRSPDSPRLDATPSRHAGNGAVARDGETSFFRINCWRDLAAHAAESLSKGDRALVFGRLKTRSWETPEGERRSVVEVEAEEVGPSLKWATATPQRTKGKTGNGPSKGGGFDEPSPF